MNWPFITRRRHLRVLAAEQAETIRVKKVKDEFWRQRDTAQQLADERLKTITRQVDELAYFRDQHPDAPLPYPKPAQGDAELRRQLRLAREALVALDGRCSELQDQNDKQARELRDLRQEAAS